MWMLKKIANNLELEDRTKKMQESECYISIIDHKKDFPQKISMRHWSIHLDQTLENFVK